MYGQSYAVAQPFAPGVSSLVLTATRADELLQPKPSHIQFCWVSFGLCNPGCATVAGDRNRAGKTAHPRAAWDPVSSAWKRHDTEREAAPLANWE